MILCYVNAQAQLVTATPISNTKSLGLAADTLIHSVGEDNIEYDTLIRNVIITQDSFVLFSDRAYIQNKSIVKAYDQVVILQGDSIQIFSDSLIYSDFSSRAELYGEVIFKNADKEMHTTYAQYDTDAKRAQYTEGATLFNQDQILVSEEGVYDIDEDQAVFIGKVVARDSTVVLMTDSLKYDLEREQAIFIAPTSIQSDSTRIYCEGGYFNYGLEKGVFYKNLKIESGDRTIFGEYVDYYGKEKKYVLKGSPMVLEPDRRTRADTIIYNEAEDLLHLIGNSVIKGEERTIMADEVFFNLKTEEYTTSGNAQVNEKSGRNLSAERLYKDENGNDVAEEKVVLDDQSENLTLKADQFTSYAEEKSYAAYNKKGQPLLLKNFEKDTLLLKSDTLRYVDQDSTSYYTGTGAVSFLKGEVSGSSQSLYYSLADSSYSFSGRAILWTDSTQITGDTIVVYLKGERITELWVSGNSFLAMQSSQGTFDQIKGEQIKIYFNKKDQINLVKVDGNVEMVYFHYDNEKLNGVNQSLCGSLSIDFKEDEIERIEFDEKPQSTFSKGEAIDAESYNLQGFSWQGDRRPIKSILLK